MAEGSLRPAAAAALLAAAAVAVEVAVPVGAAPLAILDVLVAVAFAVGGSAVIPASRSVGLLACAVATAWALGTLAGGIEIPSYAADVAVLLHRVPLAVLILVYPGRALRGSVTRGLAVAAVLAPFVPGAGGSAATAAVVCLVAVTAATRATRAPTALRAPEIAAAVVAVAVAATAILAAVDVAPSTELLVAYDIVLVATAATLLLPLASDRWTDAAAAGLVIELGSSPAGAPVTARLAEVLHDPGLELCLHMPGAPWADEAGRPAPEPVARPGQHRSITRRTLDDGTEVALIHDPAAIPDRAVAESAVTVAATAIDNARRDQEVQTRIDELRRLRHGLLDAADEERRQLEVELRSGPLRDIEQLGCALQDLPHEQAEALHSELATAHRELEEIARGLHPRALIEDGLSGAVSNAAAGLPIPVAMESTLDEAAVPPRVALTAYYIVTEALANIAKHSHARRARIELSATSRQLRVRVTDDGIGGANPAAPGLSGLRDRVHTIDGALRISSPPGAGTVVEALLPLTDG
jgi:signal transduction histidine kinase